MESEEESEGSSSDPMDGNPFNRSSRMRRLLDDLYESDDGGVDLEDSDDSDDMDDDDDEDEDDEVDMEAEMEADDDIMFEDL